MIETSHYGTRLARVQCSERRRLSRAAEREAARSGGIFPYADSVGIAPGSQSCSMFEVWRYRLGRHTGMHIQTQRTAVVLIAPLTLLSAAQYRRVHMLCASRCQSLSSLRFVFISRPHSLAETQHGSGSDQYTAVSPKAVRVIRKPRMRTSATVLRCEIVLPRSHSFVS